MNKNIPEKDRREQKYTMLLLAFGNLVASGQVSITEVARQFGSSEQIVRDILLSAREERERYVEHHRRSNR